MLAIRNKPKNPSYEAWVLDIDTAVILEISPYGRVSGVYRCSGLRAGNLKYELYGVKFSRNPDTCYCYQGFADKDQGIIEDWQLAYEIDAEEAASRLRQARIRGNQQAGFQLLTLVLIVLIIFTCARSGAGWSWSALWPFYGFYLISGYLILLTISGYLYGREFSKWQYVQNYIWLIGPLSFVGGYIAY